MSDHSVKQIISRAVLDAEFRQLLLSEPDQALSGYDLTEEEKSIFQNLSPEEFEGLSSNLESRISRAVHRPTRDPCLACPTGAMNCF